MSEGLAVRDVVVRYDTGKGAVTAVDGVSIDVALGEVLALLGPSGCGKSSLLRAVAGLEPVVAGRVTWDGSDLDGVPVHRRGFGLMFQDGQLFPHHTVAGNVEYGLRVARTPRDARRERVAELLGVVGLEGYGGRQVATLSGGERQRVALARALAPRPRLLLLDEPLSALDRGLRERLATDLRVALRETGTTAVFVTHDHDEAFEVADRVAVMAHGRVLQVATPPELWRAPASRAVAEFLGYQASWPASALERGDMSEPDARIRERGSDRSVAVGPTGLRVLPDDGAAPTAHTWPATVVESLFRPRGVEVTVDVDGPVGVERLVAVAGTTAPQPGTRVRVALDRAGCAVVGREAPAPQESVPTTP
ncbi:Fe(3+) ions import ATP-binding protein FbpC [Luteimicrobium album]|uniref:Fe(3+) ions import ATP-binding protein FbpC n=1 Tax=Luteimicrobium album TaxID=1054550 RepID=A0ABQ6HY35_9MICO|nr:ABC transporter ATP-binding protein [Luteimicrobium album]GMA23315.1 Fe(3+) ions import ATP-binding protein FbpC [Luteimicrobium album]